MTGGALLELALALIDAAWSESRRLPEQDVVVGPRPARLSAREKELALEIQAKRGVSAGTAAGLVRWLRAQERMPDL